MVYLLTNNFQTFLAKYLNRSNVFWETFKHSCAPWSHFSVTWNTGHRKFCFLVCRLAHFYFLPLHPHCTLSSSLTKKQIFICCVLLLSLHQLLKVSQIVGISEVCDQNGDRVLKERQKLLYLQFKTKRFFVKYEKYGTLSTYYTKY